MRAVWPCKGQLGYKLGPPRSSRGRGVGGQCETATTPVRGDVRVHGSAEDCFRACARWDRAKKKLFPLI